MILNSITLPLTSAEVKYYFVYTNRSSQNHIF